MSTYTRDQVAAMLAGEGLYDASRPVRAALLMTMAQSAVSSMCRQLEKNPGLGLDVTAADGRKYFVTCEKVKPGRFSRATWAYSVTPV